VDDEAEIRASVKAALLLEGMTNAAECVDGDAAAEAVRAGAYSVVVLDLMMPGKSGVALLSYILEESPGTPVIVATGTGDLDTAIRCMRAGAFDYLSKPIDRTRLITSVRHALEKGEQEKELSSLSEGLFSSAPAHPEAFADIITSDLNMRAIFRYIEAIGPTTLPVLLTGETGVGKELFARAIHRVSGRTGGFVAVNVAGLEDTLFADTLFGHAKGAYTGAETAREGMIAKAEGGTLFLDEIGDLAAESQIKLLRLLQEREYNPLGADRPRPTNARFVFATNLDVAKATGEGKFRKDLLYRLKSHHIQIPPLRARGPDLPLLLDHFFEKAANAVGKPRPTVPRELVALLRAHPFPGNVRELEGMVYDAVVRHTSRTLSLASFREAIGPAGQGVSGKEEAHGNADENLYAGVETLPTLKESGRLLVEEALRRAEGNQSAAAHMLGITRTALNRRLNRNP